VHSISALFVGGPRFKYHQKELLPDQSLLTFPSLSSGEYYCKTGPNYFHIIPNSSISIILSLGTISPTQPKSINRQLKYSLQPFKMSLMVGKHINWWLYDGTVPSVKVKRNTTTQVFWDVTLHQLVNSNWHFQRFSGSRSTQTIILWNTGNYIPINML
jgi:hypothetical protein